MEQNINVKSLPEIKISISHFCVFDIKKIFLFQAAFHLSVFLALVMVKREKSLNTFIFQDVYLFPAAVVS